MQIYTGIFATGWMPHLEFGEGTTPATTSSGFRNRLMNFNRNRHLGRIT